MSKANVWSRPSSYLDAACEIFDSIKQHKFRKNLDLANSALYCIDGPEVSSATVRILEQTLRVEFVDLPPFPLLFISEKEIKL